MANALQAERWNGATGRRWVVQRERHAALREPVVPHLLRAAAVSPGDRVLDVGCGCGELTVRLAAASGVDGAVVGLDISAVLLAVARDLAAAAGEPAVRFVRGDAQVYAFESAAFDVVVSGFGVMFFDDPVAAFANLAGALRPGGRLAFLCWQDDLRNEVFGIPLRAFAAHGVAVGPGEFDMFGEPRRIAALLTGVGFDRVRVMPVHGPARIGADVADVLGYVRATSRVRDLLAGLDEAVAGRVAATMADHYRARARPDGVWVDAASWLVTAVTPSANGDDDPA
ncbi:class I SAM-dependent methyltransferase [Phytohabitans kaempferiae]|uniref:Class I SAM-dependent methyltransferase n=1 Tax=Phytohabitans kaempferiae TaxID=1620943 RepID=A0ABV6M7G1_9ACTN